jgi:hypothetical protein
MIKKVPATVAVNVLLQAVLIVNSMVRPSNCAPCERPSIIRGVPIEAPAPEGTESHEVLRPPKPSAGISSTFVSAIPGSAGAWSSSVSALRAYRLS